MNSTLKINEIFHSIQGESTWAGLPCTFIRLAGCHLRCHYCDTEYAFSESENQTIDAVLQQVADHHCKLVEITGGEPLLQPNVHQLATRLCDHGYTVLLETGGACDISLCDPRVIRIMDVKTPGSGHAEQNHWPNIQHLAPHDEVKFVICDRNDYDFASRTINHHRLDKKVHAILMSAAAPTPGTEQIAGTRGLPIAELAQWILEDKLPVRLQTQLHKLIWDPTARGV